PPVSAGTVYRLARQRMASSPLGRARLVSYAARAIRRAPAAGPWPRGPPGPPPRGARVSPSPRHTGPGMGPPARTPHCRARTRGDRQTGQGDGQVGVDERPLVERQYPAHAVAEVRHRGHALDRRGRLAWQHGIAQANPVDDGPRLRPGATYGAVLGGVRMI